MNLIPAFPSGLSNPSNPTWRAFSFRPAFSKMSLSHMPPQTALPTPPIVQGLPEAFSLSSERLLPEHSRVSATTTFGRRRMSSKDRLSCFSTNPSTFSVHSARLTGASGICPWLRLKKTSLSVIHDRRDSFGVSAFKGLSVITRIFSSMSVPPWC